MIYSPNQNSHPIYGKPSIHTYKAPPIVQSGHHSIWGWLGKIIGFVVADIIVNTIFAVLDVVAGILTGGAADVPLIGLEEAADDALFGAEIGDVAGEGVAAGVKRVSAKLFNSTKKFRTAWKQGVNGQKISKTLYGKTSKIFIKTLAYQASGGIDYKDGKFTYDRSIWSNGQAYAMNFLFAGISMGEVMKGWMGRSSERLFQNYIKSHATYDKQLTGLYKEVLKIIHVGNSKISPRKIAIGMAELLKNPSNIEFELSKEDIETVIEFREHLIDASHTTGYGRIFLKFVNIYKHVFQNKPTSFVGNKIRFLYNFLTHAQSEVKLFSNEEINKAFEQYFEKVQEGKTYIKGVGEPNKKELFRKWLKQAGLQRKAFYIKTARGYVDLDSLSYYQYFYKRGIVGKLLTQFKISENLIERNIGLVRGSRARVIINKVWQQLFRRSFDESLLNIYQGTIGYFVEHFESLVFQFVTSPFYFLDRLSFGIARLVLLNSFVRDWVNKAINSQLYKEIDKQVASGFSDFNIKYSYKVHSENQKQLYSKYILKWSRKYYKNQISKQELYDAIADSKARFLFYNNPISRFISQADRNFPFLRKITHNVRTKIRKAYNVFQWGQGHVPDEAIPKRLLLSEAELKAKLATFPNYIPFRYSTILGVLIDKKDFNSDYKPNKKQYKTTIHQKDADGNIFAKNNALNPTSKFLGWTIFFSPLVRKPSIYQVNVARKIVTTFIRCGETSRPYYPWVYYNKVIAYGRTYSNFFKNISSRIFTLLPQQLQPLRYYSLDAQSIPESIKTHQYSKFFSGDIKTSQLEKIASYGLFKVALGRVARNQFSQPLALTSISGSLSSQFVNTLQGKKLSLGRIARRRTKIHYYRSIRKESKRRKFN